MTRDNPNTFEASASRTAMIKSRIGVGDVLSALQLDTDLGNECPTATCGSFALKQTKDGQGWKCGACGTTGDIFTLVMIKLEKSFPAARDWIEERVMPKRKDKKTGDLFCESSSRNSGEAGRAADGRSALPHGASRAVRSRDT